MAAHSRLTGHSRRSFEQRVGRVQGVEVLADLRDAAVADDEHAAVRVVVALAGGGRDSLYLPLEYGPIALGGDLPEHETLCAGRIQRAGAEQEVEDVLAAAPHAGEWQGAVQ